MSAGGACYAVIGDPVSHSLSPAMQSAAFAAAGISATYEAVRVTREDVAAFVSRARAGEFAGFNVTTPLKEAMLEHLDESDDSVREARAVNTVKVESSRLIGHNTDGAGFVRALRELWSFEPRDAAILILGVGPAARAISQALNKAGATGVWSWSRHSGLLVGSRREGAMDLMVQATPPLAFIPPAILALVGPKTKIFDLNYGTPYSSIAPNLGGERSDGLPLLLHQGVLSFECWTGRPAPLEAMRAALGCDRG
ncbi:MAG TPA: shikimate dehydrogenase [Candidatus Tumulicola sp.]|nr:shikimate dehydrogenase [Candidatus Tumulicola sp.]